MGYFAEGELDAYNTYNWGLSLARDKSEACGAET
jgi:hypothetical protein